MAKYAGLRLQKLTRFDRLPENSLYFPCKTGNSGETGSLETASTTTQSIVFAQFFISDALSHLRTNNQTIGFSVSVDAKSPGFLPFFGGNLRHQTFRRFFIKNQWVKTSLVAVSSPVLPTTHRSANRRPERAWLKGAIFRGNYPL